MESPSEIGVAAPPTEAGLSRTLASRRWLVALVLTANQSMTGSTPIARVKDARGTPSGVFARGRGRSDRTSLSPRDRYPRSGRNAGRVKVPIRRDLPIERVHRVPARV